MHDLESDKSVQQQNYLERNRILTYGCKLEPPPSSDGDIDAPFAVIRRCRWCTAYCDSANIPESVASCSCLSHTVSSDRQPDLGLATVCLVGILKSSDSYSGMTSPSSPDNLSSYSPPVCSSLGYRNTFSVVPASGMSL